MEFSYEWQREDLKKKLTKKRMKTNIIFFILGILLFFYITYSGFVYKEFDNWVIMLWFIIYFFLLLLTLFLSTKWYVRSKLKHNDKKTKNAYGKYIITVDDNKIESKWNKDKISYNWKDINKFKFTKKYFWIKTAQDKIGLVFDRNILNEDDYNKLSNYVKEHIQK